MKQADTLQDAQATLGDLEWPERQRYADASYQATFRGWMFGHLEIAMRYLELELAASDWVRLTFAEALRIFKGKRLVSKEEFDRLSDKHKLRAWTIAGDHADYTIEQTRNSLGEAIAEGISREAWVTEASELFDLWGVTGLGDHHLQTVYNTTIQGSYQHGRLQQMSTPEMRTRRPFWRYRTVADERVRPAHAAMDGATYPADHGVWKTWYPPNGFNCRCRVEPIREADAGEVQEELPTVVPDPGFTAAPTI